jgi:hypothetical protein
MRVLWDYRRTTLYAATAVASAVFVLGWAYKNEWLVHHGNAPQHVEHPAVVNRTLTPSNLDQVHTWFGPWTTVDSGLTMSDRLVLIQADGSTSASSWNASVDDTWRTSDIPQIDQLTYKEKSVEFTTGGLAIYKVAYGQPFVLEQLPNKVYAFVIDGGKHLIKSSSAQHVKHSRHNS